MVIKGLDDCGFLIFKRGFGGRDHFTDCRYWSPLEENRDINSIYVSGKSSILKKNTKCIRSNIWIYFLLKQMFLVKQIVSQKF